MHRHNEDYRSERNAALDPNQTTDTCAYCRENSVSINVTKPSRYYPVCRMCVDKILEETEFNSVKEWRVWQMQTDDHAYNWNRDNNGDLQPSPRIHASVEECPCGYSERFTYSDLSPDPYIPMFPDECPNCYGTEDPDAELHERACDGCGENDVQFVVTSDETPEDAVDGELFCLDCRM